MLTLLHASIVSYSWAWQYQKAIKWIIWVPHVVPLPYLLLLIRVDNPCQNADASIQRLQSALTEAKSYSSVKTLCSPSKNMLPLGPRTTNPAKPRIKGMRSTKPPGAPLGMIVLLLPLGYCTHVFFLLGT